MTEVTCPTCGETVVMGVPRDATIEEVRAGEESELSTEGLTKTRVVRCPGSHAVAVTFSLTASENS